MVTIEPSPPAAQPRPVKQPTRVSRWWSRWWWWVLQAVMFVVILTAVGVVTALRVNGHAARPTGPAPAPVPPATAFSSGVWGVGIDIQPGMYRTAGPLDPSKPCQIEWLKGTSGAPSDLQDRRDLTGPTQLPIQRPTVAFRSVNCGTWTKLG